MYNATQEISAKPASIVLDGRANVVITGDQPAVVTAPKAKPQSLLSIVAERKSWEAGAYRTSNQQLYSILADCYTFYMATKNKGDAGKKIRDQLNAFIAERGLRFNDSTHGITKVLKCVFYDGVSSIDRRRISTYSIVLRTALDKDVKADAIAGFIEESGGVQEIRLAKSPKGVTTAKRVELGRNAVDQADVIATFSGQAVSVKLDSTDFDKPLAALVVVRADGTLEVRGIVKREGAINAVLAAYYSANSESIVTAQTEAKQASNEEVREAIINKTAA